MNKLEDKYNSFLKNIDSVVQFIDFIEMQKGENGNQDVIELVKDVIHSSVPYNATIISLYGNIELFIDEITEAYIGEVYRIVQKYSELPKKMRDKHEMTSGEFLSNPNRFANYDVSTKELIRNLNDCLHEEQNAKINMKMILRHGGNLKSEQVFQFFKEIGIENFKNEFLENETFIKHYATMKGFSEEDARERLKVIKKENDLGNSVFVELDDTVEQRNQVAHSGKVDEKKSLEYIKEITIPFLKLFAKVVTEILTNELINLSLKKNKVNELKEIKGVFNSEILWIDIGDNTIRIGDRIAYTNGVHVGWREILSIRVDGKEESEVNAGETKAVTIKVNKKVKKNWKFFICSVLNNT